MKPKGDTVELKYLSMLTTFLSLMRSALVLNVQIRIYPGELSQGL